MAAPDDNLTGRVLVSRYRLESRLGTGGMSTVWVATDRRLDVAVAIKLLDPAIAEDPASLQRFLREAKTSAQLKNRFVVQSLDCGVDAGTPFIVMELLEGQTLRERLRARGRLAAAETASIMADIARGMQAAHAAGVVHRDLKPENVFLVRDSEREFAKVLDFGVAKRRPATDATAEDALTKPGSLFGTPNYMSPEQIDARIPVDHRTDIWSMAVMAFECLTGRVPFGERTLREQFLAICARPLPVPSEVADVPNGFDRWFARAAAQDADQRFESITSAAVELCKLCEFDANSLPPAPIASTSLHASTSDARRDQDGTPPEGNEPMAAPSQAEAAVAVRPMPMRALGWALLVACALGLAVVVLRTSRPPSASDAMPPDRAPAASGSSLQISRSAAVAEPTPTGTLSAREPADSAPTGAPTLGRDVASPAVAPVDTVAPTAAAAGRPATSRGLPKVTTPDLVSRSVRPYRVPQPDPNR